MGSDVGIHLSLIAVSVIRFGCLSGLLFFHRRDVWRRLFEPKEEWPEQQQIISTENVDLRSNMDHKTPNEPILSDMAITERRQFLRENFKDRKHPWFITPSTSSVQDHQPSLQLNPLDRENQILHQPNLDIPVGNSYMTLAQ